MDYISTKPGSHQNELLQPSRFGVEYYTDPPHNEEDPFPLLDYLQLLWFRRRLIVVVTLFVALLGFIYISQVKPVYTATSMLMIGATQTQVVDIEQVLSREFYGNAAVAEQEVLRSRSLANMVIERLNLLKYPEFNPS